MENQVKKRKKTKGGGGGREWNLRGDREIQLCPRINRAQPLKSDRQLRKHRASLGISRIPWAVEAAQPQPGLRPADVQV